MPEDCVAAEQVDVALPAHSADGCRLEAPGRAANPFFYTVVCQLLIVSGWPPAPLSPRRTTYIPYTVSVCRGTLQCARSCTRVVGELLSLRPGRKWGPLPACSSLLVCQHIHAHGIMLHNCTLAASDRPAAFHHSALQNSRCFVSHSHK